MKRYLLTAGLLVAAVPASAQVVSIENANAAPKKVSGDLSKIICERIERTGSRLDVRKVCMTALEWKEMRQGQREDFEKVQRIVNMEPSY